MGVEPVIKCPKCSTEITQSLAAPLLEEERGKLARQATEIDQREAALAKDKEGIVTSVAERLKGSPREDKPKDAWDKLDIVLKGVAGVAVPVVLVVLTFVVSNKLQSSANEQKVQSDLAAAREARAAADDAHDIDLVIKFRDVYYGKSEASEKESPRRLCIHLIRRIASPATRDQLRQFIIWDVLERNFSKPGSQHQREVPTLADRMIASSRPAPVTLPTTSPTHQRFDYFDAELADWHLLGDAAFDLKLERKDADFKAWWEGLKKTTAERWPEKDDLANLDALYTWVEKIYLGGASAYDHSATRQVASR